MQSCMTAVRCGRRHTQPSRLCTRCGRQLQGAQRTASAGPAGRTFEIRRREQLFPTTGCTGRSSVWNDMCLVYDSPTSGMMRVLFRIRDGGPSCLRYGGESQPGTSIAIGRVVLVTTGATPLADGVVQLDWQAFHELA